MGSPVAFPWECRDREDQAKVSYNLPLKRMNQALSEENLRLKRLLRDNGISWSPIAQAHIAQQNPSVRRRTRSSASAHESRHLGLPIEIILKILRFALTSSYPIVDPLSPLTPENMSDEEKARGNQIAIHFLATCRALHTEGTRCLWESNSFVFTSPEALSQFSELSSVYRNKLKSLTLRVIARYYDDTRRKHRLERTYHPELRKDHILRVRLRPKEAPLIRGGFRCYSWSQVVDFLTSLRAPYDPSFNDKHSPRPRLLPSLELLRIDLVNFCEAYLPLSGSELHEMASHELGCTLNELQVTGMPYDDAGIKASADLSGMLKDEGLYLDGSPAFLARSNHLQKLGGNKWGARVVRAYSGNDSTDDEETDASDEHDPFVHRRAHARLGTMPAAPAEEGHPLSKRNKDGMIWKRVPVSREDEERSWVQFSRISGYELSNDDWASDDEGLCPCCGEEHPLSSFLDDSADQDDDSPGFFA